MERVTPGQRPRPNYGHPQLLAATRATTGAGLQCLPAIGDEPITSLRHQHRRVAFSSRRLRERDLAPPRKHRSCTLNTDVCMFDMYT